MLKVMIVEDSILVADMLEDFLVADGYDVCGQARSVAEAVILADRHRPDLAVLDFRLHSGGLGSEIRPLIIDKTSMGILYVSGDELDKVLTKDDGDAYMQKPYGLYDLSRALQVIQKMKTEGSASEDLFPLNFHLLKDALPLNPVPA